MLPYFGGNTVEGRDRRLRLSRPLEPVGWYRFQLKGREASCVGPADRPGLDRLPLVRGHLSGSRLVREGALAECLQLMPEEEPPRLSPCRARRWPSGDLLFEELEFESEAEPACRLLLQERSSLLQLKGVPATLRAAFALALLDEASRNIGIPAAPAELRAHLGEVADGGWAQAEQVLRRLQAERQLAQVEMRELQARRQAELAARELATERQRRAAAGQRSLQDAAERAQASLEAAGARLREHRLLGERRLEVIFSFMDERFIAVVDAVTLQVLDSGICLGHPPSDEQLTLDSLPSVIKEAIDTGSLVILRRA